MTPQWQPISEPESPTQVQPLFMDAILTPNRALSTRAFSVLILVVVGVNTLLSAVFLAQGAWPVVGFLALDIVLLYVAFKVNYRDGRVQERVQVNPARLVLTRVGKQGDRLHWQLHPAWARVETLSDGVQVSAGASRLVMAAFLSPPERAAFAKALDAALRKARAYRPNTSAIE